MFKPHTCHAGVRMRVNSDQELRTVQEKILFLRFYDGFEFVLLNL